MPTIRRSIQILSTAAPLLLLSACDGYEMRLYDGFPYGNARTAGHGVEYVLARMMPVKGPVLEPAKPAIVDVPVIEGPAPMPIAEEPPPAEPIRPADEILEQKARK